MKLCCLTLMLISHSKLVQSSSECDIKSRKTISFNTSGLVKHPWKQAEDAECRDVVVMFAEEDSLPMLALVSYPRSGNSWLRQLLEAASGVFTGSHEQNLPMLHYFPGKWSQCLMFNFINNLSSHPQFICVNITPLDCKIYREGVAATVFYEI